MVPPARARRILTTDRPGAVVLLADGGIAEQGPPEQVLDSPTSERGQAFLQQLSEH